MNSPSSCMKNVGEIDLTTLGYTYKWVIHRFSAVCNEIGQVLKSPAFPTTDDGMQLKWQIWLYPKGNNEENKDFLSISIENKCKTNVTISAYLTILNSKNKKIKEKKWPQTKLSESEVLEAPQFVKRNVVLIENDVLENDKLKIFCRINVNIIKNSTIQSNREMAKNSLFRVKEFDNFEALLENGKFSDVIFTTEEKEFHLHKGILAIRSPVFEAMFQHNMKEGQESRVEIEDIKYDILKELFRFIYAAKVNDIETIAMDLLIAAEKYSIKELKLMCENTLCNDLKIENALDYLHLAITYSASKLKSQAIEFIAARSKDFVDKKEFKLLDMDVVFEIVHAMAHGAS